MKDLIILTPKSEQWPECLNELENPPEVLFCRGNLDLLKSPCVGIVGTRDCTRYGMEVAKKFASKLVEAGVIVVSGLADGIDTASHNGAFPQTIAVLGNGVNKYYPAFNRELQDKIVSDGGLLISEHEPDSTGNRGSYLLRNRIIAALSKALIVVEADVRSGALGTMRYANGLGREVFALPGNIDSHASRGTNKAIKDGYAKIIDDINYVIVGLGLNKIKDKKAKSLQLSIEATAVINLLRPGELQFDELITSMQIAPQKLLNLLTNMELDGLIEKLAGNIYKSKAN